MLTRYQPADTKNWCMQCGEASPLSVQATPRSPAAMGQLHLEVTAPRECTKSMWRMAKRSVEPKFWGASVLLLLSCAILQLDSQLQHPVRQLRASENHCSEVLLACVRKACGNARNGHSDGVVKVSRPSGLPPYLISVMPLSALSILGQQRPSAALFVYDRSIGRIPAISVLREIFGLTAAEARVAILLARGKTVREIVSMLGLSSNTIRTQLRPVFAKTQTKRQSELM